jgi:hypothetical protein
VHMTEFVAALSEINEGYPVDGNNVVIDYAIGNQ